MTARCECGHRETSHELTSNGRRSWCTYYGRGGPCGCRSYTVVLATAGRAQPEE